jgi:hypothetical protein
MLREVNCRAVWISTDRAEVRPKLSQVGKPRLALRGLWVSIRLSMGPGLVRNFTDRG